MTKEKLINPEEVEIKLSFTNYKLLKKEEFNLTGSCVYFIKGQNETGKTSILNALRAAHEIKDDTHKKVTRGETEGINEFTIPGPNGKMYNVTYEFTDTNTKFVVFDEEGNKISKITEMRDIFKYNHVDATTFIGWSRTADGRRKQKEHILQLLPAESYINYKEVEREEEALFNQRTATTKSLDVSASVLKEYELTAEEKRIEGTLDEAKKQLLKREEEYNSITSIDTQIDKIVSEMLSIEARMNNESSNQLSYIKSIELANENLNIQIVDAENQIKQLQAKIASNRDTIKINLKAIEEREKQLATITEEPKVRLNNLRKEKEELEKKNTTSAEVKSKLSLSIENGKMYIRNAERFHDKLLKYNEYKQKYDELLIEKNDLTTSIEEKRKVKEQIITSAEFPVDNLSFDPDGYLTIDGFRFDENQICESDNILIVAQLMCRMNETPIQILGDASLLDFNKLDKLYDIAAENGKIMFVDEIDRNLDKLVIVGYEKHNKEEAPKKDKAVKKKKEDTTNKDLF